MEEELICRRCKAVVAMLCLLIAAFPLCSFAAQVDNAGNCKKNQIIKPAGMVNSSNGGVYRQGQYGIIMKYITFKQDQLYDGGDSIDFVCPVTGEKPAKKAYEKKFDQIQLTLRANLFDRVDARVVIPYMNKELKRKTSSTNLSDSNSDLGDIKVFGRYSIFSQHRKDPVNLALGFGVKVPTGSTDETDSSGATPGYLQTGSGSWDPLFELGIHKVIQRHWISSYFMYQPTTEGEQGDLDFEQPDVFKYNFGYGYALNRYLDLQLELNGEFKSKAEKAGISQENSGGHTIYLTPGFHTKLCKGLRLDAGFAFPVYRDLNGEQLSEDFRIITKLRYKF